MGVYTPRRNLYKPDIGETGWGDKVNQNFDILDDHKHVRADVEDFFSAPFWDNIPDKPPIAKVLVCGIYTTGSDGRVTINFPKAVSRKPAVFATCEADNIATIDSFVTDTAGNYTGVVIRVYKIIPAISKTTRTVVASVSDRTGDAHGRYWIDTANYIHHDHTVVYSTTIVLADVSLSAVVGANVNVHVCVIEL